MTIILLENKTGNEAQILLFEAPEYIISARDTKEVPATIKQLETLSQTDKYAVGYFSYELGYLLEPKLNQLLPAKRKYPLIWFGVFSKPQILGATEQQDWLIKKINKSGPAEYTFKNIKLSDDHSSYSKKFSQAKENIAKGDIYQLNLTFNSNFQFQGNIFKLYQDLKRKQRMEHGALIVSEEFTILSASPEHFLSIQDQQAMTTPMKGTAKRGRTFEEDEKIKIWLQEDKKSQAENLMIVDLMRNDLARISEIGSIKVDDLFTIKTFPTLHQMTSNVVGTLKPKINITNWLQALFPPGSITGAPKLRAMELIKEIEQYERGIYTGTIGMLAPKNNNDIKPNTYFNVAIRTLTIWPDGIGQMGIGSGVVADSDPDDEYNECLLKMKFLNEAYPEFELLETLSYSPQNGYLYFAEHMQRLQKSASYFGYMLDIKEIEDTLIKLEKDIGNNDHIVRLTISQEGRINLTTREFSPPKQNTIFKFIISEKRMNKENIFLYHKTTNRAFYDDEFQLQQNKTGCDEVIFLNEQQEITEGSRTNIFIKKDNCLQTPHISSGLLPGTLRESLLKQKKCVENIITLKDLEKAEKIFIGNSVRGLVHAQKL